MKTYSYQESEFVADSTAAAADRRYRLWLYQLPNIIALSSQRLTGTPLPGQQYNEVNFSG